MEGQVNQIELTNQFVETQISKAQPELAKNEKLYNFISFISGSWVFIYVHIYIYIYIYAEF